MSSDSEKSKGTQVQVRFRTANEKYAVPDSTISIPTNIESDGLNKLVKNLLEESSSTDLENDELSNVQFDFILLDELVRGSLSDVLSTKEDVSFETVFEVLYIEKQRPPDPKKNVNHDDWVAGVSGKLLIHLNNSAVQNFKTRASIWVGMKLPCKLFFSNGRLRYFCVL